MTEREQRLIATDGRPIILRPNGTWIYETSGAEGAKIEANDFDFRNTKWGMNTTQVEQSEDVALQKQENMVYRADQIAGFDTNVIYVFASDKLVRGRYAFFHSHSNRTAYISDFESMKNILRKKYGEPTANDQFWKDDLYKGDYPQWGMAIATGRLSYFTRWVTNRTTIILALVGDNHEIRFYVEYASNLLAELEREVKESLSMAQL
jgi:hypothetical protein